MVPEGFYPHHPPNKVKNVTNWLQMMNLCYSKSIAVAEFNVPLGKDRRAALCLFSVHEEEGVGCQSLNRHRTS